MSKYQDYVKVDEYNYLYGKSHIIWRIWVLKDTLQDHLLHASSFSR